MQKQDTRAAKLLRSLDVVPALKLIWQSSKKLTLVTLGLTFLQGVLPLVSLYLLKLIVDAVEFGLTNSDVDFTSIGGLIVLAAAVALFSAVLQAGASYVNEVQAITLSDFMLDRLHAKSSEVDLEYYENPKYHDTLHLAQQQAPQRPRMILAAMVRLAQNGISLLAVAGLLFLFHWSVPLILLAAALPGLVVRLRYAETIYRWHRKAAPEERLARYFNVVLTRDTHAKEMRLFNLAKLFMSRFLMVRHKLRGEQIDLATKRSVAELVAQACGTVAIFSALLFIAYRTLQGSITLGALVMYFQAFQRGQGFLQEMMRALADLYSNNLFLSTFHEFLQFEPKIVDPPKPRTVPRSMEQGILFNQVSFQYPDSERPATQEVSLEIRPGETVALVGANGAGKTTLVKLLCRLYEPTYGRITLDGIDLRQFRGADLRQEISVVFQDYAKYHLTARENIWLGNVLEQRESSDIEAAARLSGIDEAIRDLPRGYETMLGKWFESGEELSIGEWQKIALARAFLRKAQITILDEPTSALDPQTEVEVIGRFRQLTQDRTAILISHRLSTVKMADRIYVMEKGRVVESGSHDELMRAEGAYAVLFSSQAQQYR